MQSIMCLLIVITLKYSEKHALPLRLKLPRDYKPHDSRVIRQFKFLVSFLPVRYATRKAEQGVGIRGYNVHY